MTVASWIAQHFNLLSLVFWHHAGTVWEFSMGNPWILVEESSDSDGIFHGADSGIPKKKDLNCDVTGMIIHKDNHPQMAASLNRYFQVSVYYVGSASSI